MEGPIIAEFSSLNALNHKAPDGYGIGPQKLGGLGKDDPGLSVAVAIKLCRQLRNTSQKAQPSCKWDIVVIVININIASDYGCRHMLS